MRGLAKLTWVEMKLYLREPMAAFFTLAFPLLMLFLFGSIYGNKPTPFFGGYGAVDVSVPAYTAMLIGSAGLFSLAIFLASYREQGILRRLQCTPLAPLTVLLSQLLVVLAMMTAGMMLLVLAGKVFYHLRFNGSVLSVAAAYLLSSLSICAIGLVLAALLPTARTAQVVAMALYYPMIFLSGATIPREVLPAGVRAFSQVLPLTHVVNLLRGLWIGEPWGKHLIETAVLLLVLVSGCLIAGRAFRWD